MFKVFMFFWKTLQRERVQKVNTTPNLRSRKFVKNLLTAEKSTKQQLKNNKELNVVSECRVNVAISFAIVIKPNWLFKRWKYIFINIIIIYI